MRRRVALDEVLVGAGPGTTIELAGGGSARAFAVRHNTTSLGWAITADDGARPALVFAGDGTVEPFRDNPANLDAPLAIVDCSLIDPGTRVAARLGGHGHLMDWIELLPDLRCDALVLAHLPPEATAASILERLPDELRGRPPSCRGWRGPGPKTDGDRGQPPETTPDLPVFAVCGSSRARRPRHNGPSSVVGRLVRRIFVVRASRPQGVGSVCVTNLRSAAPRP